MSAAPSGVRREVFGDRPARELVRLLRPGSVRPLSRVAGSVAWTASCLLVFLTGMAAAGVVRNGRRRWRPWMIRLWARGLGRLAGMRVERRGPRPDRPFFLVANHLSYVDIILLLAEVDAVFVAKRELVAWPVIGWLARLGGTIFVDRSQPRDAVRVLGDIEAGIARGEGIVVFPEGTSSSGDEVQTLKPALFEWAARSAFPVHVATIRYDAPPGFPPARDVVCWWGDMSFLPHLLGLFRLPGFRATLWISPTALSGRDRTTLARQARTLMTAALESGAPASESE